MVVELLTAFACWYFPGVIACICLSLSDWYWGNDFRVKDLENAAGVGVFGWMVVIFALVYISMEYVTRKPEKPLRESKVLIKGRVQDELLD